MTMKKINYVETASFRRDFKNLKKRFLTLAEDIAVAKKSAIELFHLYDLDNDSIVLIAGFSHEKYQIYKLRKFACRALKGKGVKSGIRIVYAYDIALRSVFFIEIYFKADQEIENKEKIKTFLELA